MGHTRLGRIPKSRKWQALVSMMSSGAFTSASSNAIQVDVAAISSQSLDAAQMTLRTAIDDTGLHYTFFCLTQIALAARDENINIRLANIGIQLNDDSTIVDLTSQLQTSIDDYNAANFCSSDFGNMAQQAAGEVLVELLSSQTGSLFESRNIEALKEGLHDLSTKKGFSNLGQKFFGSFISRFLNFYLSRITADQAGGSVLPQVGSVSTFNKELELHCYQSARIVHDYCGEWYSKTEWEQGVNLENTAHFLKVALEKLQKEMQQQQAEAE